ncbi:uncharacterized protein LOC122089503 [Macadamia integrifolia]|uniref:uncharacterized protein LOC122089503 n=1 Tax=Macadamia integrifolia TaxID=60698 RepID=UPI001C4F7044|nr:uncharacterized protein LOC122089503 [Macadamia integrifolia]
MGQDESSSMMCRGQSSEIKKGVVNAVSKGMPAPNVVICPDLSLGEQAALPFTLSSSEESSFGSFESSQGSDTEIDSSVGVDSHEAESATLRTDGGVRVIPKEEDRVSTDVLVGGDGFGGGNEAAVNVGDCKGEEGEVSASSFGPRQVASITYRHECLVGSQEALCCVGLGEEARGGRIGSQTSRGEGCQGQGTGGSGHAKTKKVVNTPAWSVVRSLEKGEKKREESPILRDADKGKGVMRLPLARRVMGDDAEHLDIGIQPFNQPFDLTSED